MRARSLVLVSLVAVPVGSFAQDSQPKPEAPREPGHAYEEVVVTGTPTKQTLFELAQPVNVLSDDALALEQQSNLGDTLARQPGVSSSSFAPGAGRPVIRGLDGDHVRVLSNGIGSIDASSTSADHAVAIDPIALRRIEVVRGPAALLYGTNAVGGVVNAIDGRIAERPLDSPFSGAFEGWLGSVDRSERGALALDGAAGPFALHFDGFARRGDDLAIPGRAGSGRFCSRNPGEPACAGKRELHDSQADSEGAALGGSWVGERGWLGLAPSSYDSRYGVVKEPDVSIELEQRRLDVSAGLRSPLPRIAEAKLKLGLADYEHVELEGSEVGTTFENDGLEGRLEILHEPLGPFEGALGIQAQRSDFEAVGAEAFLPPTLTRAYSAFVFEEVELGDVRLQLGGRVDRQTVRATRTAEFPDGGSEGFTTGSGSLGFTWSPADDYALALSAAFTERAPNAQELFANGEHVATDSFEIGDRGLSPEESLGLDLSLRKRAGRITGGLTFFANRIADFITLVETDASADPPEFTYRNVDSLFLGAELELALHLIDAGEDSLHLELSGDVVRATDREADDPLPRIPPLRFGGALVYGHGPIGARLDVHRLQAQRRVADFEEPTRGSTVLDVALSYELPLRGRHAHFYVVGSNLTNDTVRNHVSFLKDVAPLGGRGVRGGVRLEF